MGEAGSPSLNLYFYFHSVQLFLQAFLGCFLSDLCITYKYVLVSGDLPVAFLSPVPT